MASSSQVMVGAHPPVLPTDGIDFSDLETSRLIAQLTLEDITGVTGRRKGKARDDLPLSDEEVAFKVQCEYWEDIIRIIDDHLLAQSIRNAVESDSAHLDVLSAMEQAALDDHEAALALSRGLPMPEPSQAQQLMDRKDFFEPLVEGPNSTPIAERQVAFKRPLQGSSAMAGPSSSGPRNGQADQEKAIHEITDSVRKTHIDVSTKGKEPSISALKQTRAQCIICGDLIRGPRLHNSCGHDYCTDCTVSLIEACTRDETLYPPRCCHRPFSYEDLVPMLNAQLRRIFDAKRRELDVPAENRIYCPTSACSQFLGSSDDPTMDILCTGCGTLVCPKCRQIAHWDSCSDNAATQAVRELARNEHWQTCPQCKAIIELNQGCYHITCRCRAQFCYVCAETWKNCTCPQWDEDRIVYTAQQRVQQDMEPGTPANQVAYQERVNAMVNVLRNNHDCLDHRWRSRRGPAECEECLDYMPIFILVCQNCRLQACKRCAHNRL